MEIIKDLIKLQPEMQNWRRDIHSHPEIAFEEHRTAQIVAEKLESFGIEVETGIAGTGVVGTLKKGTGNRSVGLRADLDALLIHEANDFAHKSQNPGKMHACGHDGHTTMLLGAAKYLAEKGNFDGTVNFIFQPAEENEGGGKAMIDEGLFDKYPVESVYGMHNIPGMPVGSFAIKPGPIMAAFDIFNVKIIGKGGHAAQPQHANDPMVASGLTITALQSLISRQLDPFKSAVLSITKIEGGSAFNVIPDTVTIGGTLRSTDQKNRNEMLDKIKKVASNTCAISNCELNIEIRPGYPPTINNKECAKLASKIFKKTFGDNSINLKETPTMGSEDFSYMLEEKPGAYIWLGAGANSEKLHSPFYDFNDELLPIGAQYWTDLAENILVE